MSEQLSTYGLEKLVEAHNSVGFDRQNDHQAESRMADIRRRKAPWEIPHTPQALTSMSLTTRLASARRLRVVR